jgi:hypothetical protein
MERRSGEYSMRTLYTDGYARHSWDRNRLSGAQYRSFTWRHITPLDTNWESSHGGYHFHETHRIHFRYGRYNPIEPAMYRRQGRYNTQRLTWYEGEGYDPTWTHVPPLVAPMYEEWG